MSLLISLRIKFIKLKYRNYIRKECIGHPVILLRREYQASQETLWREPKGYETGIYIYNSLSKSKVQLRTIQPKLITWYNCGPTVYDSAHIGHALCYVKLDIVRRILQDIFQLNVVKVTGVTNIDDKIIKRAKEENISVEKLTEKYEKEFFLDMSRLNVLPSSLTTRVTDFVPHIISFISNIVEKGLAYSVGEGTVYFDTKAYGRYGKLVHGEESELKQQIAGEGKRSVRDFALWKGVKETDTVFWESPWGQGRPGWHIECSVMASKIFGEKLDLHSGGIDLMFPHHENEEAQCCAHHGCEQWCNYWLHTGHLHIKGQTKMSKSLKNTISVEEFLKDYSANVFRLFCLFTHHRTPVEYTPESMESFVFYLRKLNSFFQDSEAYIIGRSSTGSLDDLLILQTFLEVRDGIRNYLANDFNTRKAMFLLFELITLCNKEMNKSRTTSTKTGRSVGVLCAVRGYIQHLLTSLGMEFEQQSGQLTESDALARDETLVRVIDSSLAFRQSVKNFALLKTTKEDQEESLSKEEKKKRKLERSPLLKACDKLRMDFSESGVDVKDYSEGTSWRYNKKKQEATDTSKGPELQEKI